MIDCPEQETQPEEQHESAAHDQRPRPGGRVVERPRQSDGPGRGLRSVRGDDHRDVRRNFDGHREFIVLDEVIEPEVRTVGVGHLGLSAAGQSGCQFAGLLVQGDRRVAGIPNPRHHIGRATVAGEHRAGALHRDRLVAGERIKRVA